MPGLGYAEKIEAGEWGGSCRGAVIFEQDTDISEFDADSGVYSGVVFEKDVMKEASFPVQITHLDKEKQIAFFKSN